MSNIVNYFLEWVKQNFQIIKEVIVPIIVACIGIFSVTKYIRRSVLIKQNNNVTGDKNSVSTVNITDTKTGKNNTILQGNQIQIINHIGKELQNNMFPRVDKAFSKINTNCEDFLHRLEQKLSNLTDEELDKFAEPDLVLAFQNAIRSAVITDDRPRHEMISRLIIGRIKMPKRNIVALAIDEAIAVTSKLDVNLIKILAFSFLFSRTKYLGLENKEALVSKLSKSLHVFKDLEISVPKFEYLEAISCGRIIQFSQRSLTSMIKESYPQLFFKSITEQQIKASTIADYLKKICFNKSSNNTFEFNCTVALCLFEDRVLRVNNHPFNIDAEEKEKLKDFYKAYFQTEDEIEHWMKEHFSGFDMLSNQWKSGFDSFSLTAVGIAVGSAYLEQADLGTYDINTWIN